MNSALQCLSHTKFLVQYFLNTEHDFEQDLNKDNILGSQGKLAKAFAKVIRHLWFGTSTSYSPWEFKNAVSDFAQQFRGYEQHDSQELLSFVLDGLHEDLNRVKVKPYTEELKFEGTPTEGEVARAYWEQHLSRNQSLIVDSMYGQYRSQVTCPTCKKTSLKFDPFLMLSVDLPPPVKRYEVCIVPNGLSDSVIEAAFPLDSDSYISTLKEKVHEAVPELGDLLFAEVDNNKVEEVLRDSAQMPEALYRRKLVAMELPKVRAESGVTAVINFMKNDMTYGYSRMVGFVHPRVISLNPEQTLKDVHFAIFGYVRSLLSLQSTTVSDDESEKMEIEESPERQMQREVEEQYTRLYNDTNESHWGYSRRDLIYKLKVVNYNNQWNSKKGGYDNCPYCGTSHYTNCSLPFNGTLLRDFLSGHDPHRIFQIELCCPSDLLASSYRSEVTSHSSLESSDKQHDSWGAISLYQCLDFTCKEKTLTADNMWYCSVCKEHVLGAKKMTIYKLPKVLTIHLKRFKQGEYLAQKNEKLVEFPITDLDMSRYIQSDLQQTARYSLFAINEHSGSLGFGHYTAYAKDERGWCSYNDSHVSESGDERYMVSASAYVLFYEAVS